MSLGGAITHIINSNLPLTHYTDGQRVPEDLRRAKSDELVDHLLSCAVADDGLASTVGPLRAPTAVELRA